VILETARTIVRRWREADIPAYAQIVADPDVVRLIGDGSVQTSAQATTFIHHISITCASKHGSAAGFCGLWKRKLLEY
jgi:RimJ/RimL family protein N-acetyltransferase